jgi:proliferating cell nuclear antigen
MGEFIFEARTVQTSNIKSLFVLLASVITDCNLIITKDSIKIVKLNNTEIALIHIKLDAECFEDYIFESEKPLIVGIHTSNFLKIIKTIKHDETLSFLIKKGDSDVFYVRKENNCRNSTNTFKVPLCHINHDNYTLPSVNFDGVISMASSEFQRICKNFYSLGASTVEIKNIENRVYFSGEGEFCSIEGVVGDSEDTKFGTNTTEIIQSIFDIQYLLLFSNASNLSKTVYLYLKNDYPLILSYKIGTLGELKFVISPVTS